MSEVTIPMPERRPERAGNAVPPHSIVDVRMQLLMLIMENTAQETGAKAEHIVREARVLEEYLRSPNVPASATPHPKA